MKKRILIKGVLIRPNRNGFVPGIGRSNVELINALVKINDPDVVFSCYSIGVNFLNPFPYKWPIKCYSYPILGRFAKYADSWLEPFYRKYIIGYDLVHLTGNYDGVWKNEHFVLTIHDLMIYENDEKKRSRFEKCAKYSKAIFTCSEYSKKQIIEKLHVPEKKVHVVYWGINHNLFFKHDDSAVTKITHKYGISTRYIFSCVGYDMTNRKNSDITLAAFRKAMSYVQDISLVLTWKTISKEIEKEYKEEIESGRIKILTGIPDEDLVCLYSGALVSVFISSSEGFGFPVLESFACGTPCITCNNTSLSEIGSDKAFYVKERDINETCNAMLYFAKNGKGDTSSLMAYAKNFTWEKAAKEFLTVYKDVI